MQPWWDIKDESCFEFPETFPPNSSQILRKGIIPTSPDAQGPISLSEADFLWPASFGRIRSRPSRAQGSLVKTVTSCSNLFSLWPVQCPSQWPGVETRDHLKNSLLFDVESIGSNRLNLGSSIWWFHKLEHCLILDSFWSKLWEKVYLGGNFWLLGFSELI